MDPEQRKQLDQAVHDQIIRRSELKPNHHISQACDLEHYERTNYPYVGGGEYFTVGGTHPAAVDGQNYTVALLECQPGKGPSLHCHTTEETFFALSGQLEVYWGEDGEHSAILEPMDAAVFQPGVWHGVRAAGDEPGKLLAIIGEGHPAPPIFAPTVEEELRETEAS
jgi:mannose-6-phosphate isomerase-like protein (cupin superfamily)